MEPSLFTSLGAVASLINRSSDLDQTLQHLLEAVCRRSPWSAGGIMSIDQEGGWAETVARYDPHGLGARVDRRWPLAESPSRIALELNEPVIIHDAQQSEQFPGYRRESIEHDYHTVVVLPMAYRNARGHRIVLSLRSRQAVEVTPDELAFLQFVVHLGQIAMDKARSLAEEQAFGERLRAALVAHGALLDQVLADESVSAAAAMVEAMLPHPPVIVDLTTRRVMAERSPLPDLLDDAAWRTAVTEDLGPQFLELAGRAVAGHRYEVRDLPLVIDGRSLRLPAILCPLTIDRTRVGALIVFAPAPDAGDLDHLLLDSARFGLSVQMMRSHVAMLTATRNLEDLFADLLNGTRPLPAVVERAERLGLDLAKPARLVVLTPGETWRASEAEALELHRTLTPLTRQIDARATVAIRPGAIVVHCAADARRDALIPPLTQRLIAELRKTTGTQPVAVIGRICRIPEDYQTAWREGSRLTALAHRFGRTGLVDAADFGPFPVLMSAVDADEMRAFVARLIGAVVDHDAAEGTDYVHTLAVFLDHGGRSQPSADALGIHVTTLRYRLERLGDLFGLSLATPDARFALQLALQFQRVLQPPAPSESE
ncbi:PucR family transcriptional regulator [Aliidongia dinghuensis]|uniref:PucR family transcriptional regulator n=1 Tax=Aliidongia dinghuensis TaxID=1867774 RepID=A0A8J2YYP9_9PROT|nr:helix-turn-helix domain-containing protein [Aliidongia dinghuensis]GGF39635.1 PucR family transcriptional regulator [Aliidongia dinghuensis]